MDYTKKLIELVKEGKEIDLTQTRTYYGKIYTIVVKQDNVADVVVDETPAEVVAEAKVSEEVEVEALQAEDNEAKEASNVAKKTTGRKASAK